MGRIRTTLVKRTSKKLHEQNKGRFTADFSENKKVLGSVADIKTKRLRNLIAGYITRLAKKK